VSPVPLGRVTFRPIIELFPIDLSDRRAGLTAPPPAPIRTIKTRSDVFRVPTSHERLTSAADHR
jgi:hypothetical protein